MTTSLSIGLGDCAEMLVAFTETREREAAIRTIASDGVMTRNVRKLVNEWGEEWAWDVAASS